MKKRLLLVLIVLSILSVNAVNASAFNPKPEPPGKRYSSISKRINPSQLYRNILSLISIR